MSSSRSVRGALLVFLAIVAALGLSANQAFAAGAADDHTVLILDTSVTGGASSVEAVQAGLLGFTVEIATAAQWGAKTQADFATYRALVLGDPNCVVGTAPITAAIANKSTWSPVINGNVIVIGTDEILHHLSHPGGTTLTKNGIGFAANIAGKTGLFVSLSCYYTSSPAVTVSVLDQIGTFTTTAAPGCFNDAHIVAVHPALAGLTDPDLQNWSCSVHEVLTVFPASFIPLAIARGVTGPGSLTFADGSSGIPYILARGSSLQAVGLNILKSGPAAASVGDNITYTITYGNTGSTPAVSTVITDPVPVGTTFVSADNGGTNVAGVVTWNIGTLANGTSGLTLHFTVHIDAAGAITNTNYKIQATGVAAVTGPDVVTNPGVAPTPTPFGGPAGPGPTDPIPTLSPGLLIALAAALAALGVIALRRQ